MLRRIALTLDRAFRYQKAAFKPLYQAHIRCLHHEISCVGPTQQQGRLSCRGFDPINVKKKLYTLIPTALQRAEREQDGRWGL